MTPWWFAQVAAAQTTPNILVIIADDLGVDKLSSYNVDSGFVEDPEHPVRLQPVTPAIDELVQSGVRFTRAWSSPNCSPTRAGILTGRMPTRTGVGFPLNGMTPELGLAPSEVTFAEAVLGYETGLFGKWHLGDLSAPGPIANPIVQGFDVYEGVKRGVPSYWEYVGEEGDNSGAPTTRARETTYNTEQVYRSTRDFVLGAGEPWLAVASFNAPHSAEAEGYSPEHLGEGCSTRRSLERTTRADDDQEVYRAMVECVDSAIGLLLQDLAAAGSLDGTVILFLGDNGTTADMMDDDFPRGGGTTADDRGGKNTPYESGIRVPLIVTEGAHIATDIIVGRPYEPGDLVLADPARGVESDALVSTVDVFQTILDLTGTVQVPRTGVDSTSFVNQLTNPNAPGRRWVQSEEFNQQSGGAWDGLVIVREDRWKLIVTQQADGSGRVCQSSELYDLGGLPPDETDRAETCDLSVFHPEAVDRLRDILDERVNDSVAAGGTDWFRTLGDSACACPQFCL